MDCNVVAYYEEQSLMDMGFPEMLVPPNHHPFQWDFPFETIYFRLPPSLETPNWNPSGIPRHWKPWLLVPIPSLSSLKCVYV